ncbi:MAG: hypothetical protein JNJ80_23430 [Gemmatimonadetes bacterium]|nr:hypothetical protein [Gemmatimonadota bacterium]
MLASAALLIWCATGLPGRHVDTILIGSDVLNRARSPNACRGEPAPGWTKPVPVGQATRGVIGATGVVAVVDGADNVLRLLEPTGAWHRSWGRKGSGPGEFGPAVTVVRWYADTFAIQDLPAGRISLFTNGGFQRSIPFGHVPGLAVSGYFGPLASGKLVFGTGRAPAERPDVNGFFRDPIELALWSEGAAAPTQLRSGIPGPESYPVQVGERRGIGRRNLGRTTSFGAAGTLLVIHDNASPRLDYYLESGAPSHSVRLDLPDPAVTAHDRDTMLARLELAWARAPEPPASIKARIREFPSTRAAAVWHGTDPEGGVWLGVYPTAVGAPALFLRVMATGQLDRCLRLPEGSRALAFGRGFAAVVTEGASSDDLTLWRTAPYPER